MRSLVLAAALIATPALADLQAVWQVEGEGKMRIDYRDDRNIRMEMDDGYLLLDDGVMYSVSRQGDRWVAMNIAEMGAAMADMRSRMALPEDEQADAPDEDDFRLVDTGRTETIAGYRGKVYEVIVEGSEKEEAVLSDHADVVAAHAAFEAMVGAMAGALSGEKPVLPDDLPGGLLRGGNIRLESIRREKKPDAWFDLPENVQVQSMQDMMKQFMMPGQ